MQSGERKQRGVRRLERHELELWEQVTRHVRPMPGKLPPAAVSHALASRPARTGPLATPTPHKPQPAHIKPLAPLDNGVLRRLSRGRSDPEAKIDLHGMRQAEAHHYLRSFLQRAHADGLRLTLVVTGKGASSTAFQHQDERGVLRRMLPHWLAAPDLRHVILGFTEASRRHGGEGAFYVQLRASNRRSQ